MGKNDFDIDLNFEEEDNFDPTVFLGTEEFDEDIDLNAFTDEELGEIVESNFSFRVSDIINELNLKRPIYRSTVNYGHFGKDYLPWEQFKKIIY